MKKARINRKRIRQLIYPTIGFPAIVGTGERLVLEFDPRDRDWGLPLPTLTGFKVTAISSNHEHAESILLPVRSVSVGFSRRWPRYAEDVEPRAWIYLVAVDVPSGTPCHLYDLQVKASSNGSRVTDSQPHALQVVSEYKTEFKFAHMTDIHVWGLEAAYISGNTHERGWRHEDHREADGYGATYYHKAIGQMNTIRPDFIVYTGDYDFGLTWPYLQDYSEFDAYKDSPWAGAAYETWFELDWFYAETLKLEVPVFMLPGNHDGWARFGVDETLLEEDYLESWCDLFGPQHFSFDYGPDCHFAAINSMDWTPEERALHWAIPMALLGPHKWQGQVRGGGDGFQAGWTIEREEAVDEEDFDGQLRWLKKDLEAHSSAKVKALLLHHDPWKRDGSGSMFEHMPVIPGLLPWGGRGAGRLALIKLARENNVGLVLSGHDHSDAYGTVAWEDGGGEVKFANTTSTQFQDGERQGRWEYPGYRLVHVKDGEVETCHYAVASDASGEEMHYSWPFYAGTTVGGPNDLESLVDPAILTVMRDGVSSEAVECVITNTLTGSETEPGGGWSGDLDNAIVEFAVPCLEGGHYYEVENGTIVEILNHDGGGKRTFRVAADVSHATSSTEPSNLTVRLSKSDKTATAAPRCSSFEIDGGAAATRESRVRLSFDAVDAGGSGYLQMKVWNEGESERGARWGKYQESIGWDLIRRPGAHKVKARFRDGAMPPNVSGVFSAAITLDGSAPEISAVTPTSPRVGETVIIKGADFGASITPASLVSFGGIAADILSWRDSEISCVVPLGACSGQVVVSADTGDAEIDLDVTPTVTGIVPDHVYNEGTVHIDNLEGSGFAAGVQVKLTVGPVDIPAKDVTVVSPQSIACDFELGGIAPGYYSVVVSDGSGSSDMLPGALVVDNPPPRVAAVKPESGKNTGIVTLTVSGEGFLEGMRIWLARGGIEFEAQGVTVESSKSAACSLDITGAAVGRWRVVVRNKDHKDGELARGFAVD